MSDSFAGFHDYVEFSIKWQPCMLKYYWVNLQWAETRNAFLCFSRVKKINKKDSTFK